MRQFGILASVAVFACLGGSVAGAGSPVDLSVSDLFTASGHMKNLAAGTTYQVSDFPIGLRVTPGDASWAGAQWKAARNKLPPFYGWAAVGHGGTNPKIGGSLF